MAALQFKKKKRKKKEKKQNKTNKTKNKRTKISASKEELAKRSCQNESLCVVLGLHYHLEKAPPN